MSVGQRPKRNLRKLNTTYCSREYSLLPTGGQKFVIGTFTAVPEPTSLIVLAGGALGLGWTRQHRDGDMVLAMTPPEELENAIGRAGLERAGRSYILLVRACGA